MLLKMDLFYWLILWPAMRRLLKVVDPWLDCYNLLG